MNAAMPVKAGVFSTIRITTELSGALGVRWSDLLGDIYFVYL